MATEGALEAERSVTEELRKGLAAARLRETESKVAISRLVEAEESLKLELDIMEETFQGVQGGADVYSQRARTAEAELKKVSAMYDKLELELARTRQSNHLFEEECSGQQRTMLQMKARQWEQDGDVATCRQCKNSFSSKRRKHHCRNCGRIFCNDCSSQKIKLAGSKKDSRCCDTCVTDLTSAS